jgi:cytochrome c oxidase subunit 2
VAATDTRSEFDAVQALYLPVAVAVAAVVFGFFAFGIVRYRARAGREPAPTEDHNVREVAIACLIGAIVAVLLVVTLHANQAETKVAPRPSFRVNVVAFRWGWSFTYPSVPGAADITTPQHPPVLHVPAGRVVQIHLVTHDVVHAFFLPGLRYKADAWPGTTRTFDLTFPDAGAYQGHCAQFCGLKHADMVFSALALPPAAFRAWAARARRGR